MGLMTAKRSMMKKRYNSQYYFRWKMENFSTHSPGEKGIKKAAIFCLVSAQTFVSFL